MTEFTAADHRFMTRALRLAARGSMSCHPNPRVGCVLVRDGKVVGEGWHAIAGEAHAELHALAAAGLQARGATAYVTLEPCAHAGRTGPCTEALIAAGVSQVVAAMQDPFPDVAGQGFIALADAGIAVRAGLMEPAARELNRGFLSRVERGRPFVTLKLAMSLDGAIAMRSGESRWITGPAARADVQQLRARSGAVMTGSGTVLADDPQLTVRPPLELPAQPLRVIVDSRLRTPPGARVLAADGDCLLYCSDDSARGPLEAAGAGVVCVASSAEGVDLGRVLADLAERGVNELLVEAGPGLSGSLLAAGTADELVIYQSPHIMGSETQRAAATPRWEALSDRLVLDIRDRRVIGPDLRITARPGGERH